MLNEGSTDSISLSTTLPATPQAVYQAWLSSAGHTAMSGGKAETSAEVGAPFTAWGGYIQGQNVELEVDRRIVQRWRTHDFPKGAPDSQLEITLTAVPEGTRLDLTHRDIPSGQGVRYHGGWQDRYFTPMTAYFTRATT